jgi:hypothetical protein
MECRRFGNTAIGCTNGILGVESDRFRPLHEFKHFNQFLSGLDVTDVVLPAFEPFREINLAQARLLALFDKEFAQRLMSWRIEGASHPSVLNGLFTYGKNQYFRIRKTKPGPPPLPRVHANANTSGYSHARSTSAFYK